MDNATRDLIYDILLDLGQGAMSVDSAMDEIEAIVKDMPEPDAPEN